MQQTIVEQPVNVNQRIIVDHFSVGADLFVYDPLQAPHDVVDVLVRVWLQLYRLHLHEAQETGELAQATGEQRGSFGAHRRMTQQRYDHNADSTLAAGVSSLKR